MAIDVIKTLVGLEGIITAVESAGIENRDAVVKLLKMTIADVKELEQCRVEATEDYERMKGNRQQQSASISKAATLADEIKALAGQISIMDIPF